MYKEFLDNKGKTVYLVRLMMNKTLDNYLDGVIKDVIYSKEDCFTKVTINNDLNGELVVYIDNYEVANKAYLCTIAGKSYRLFFNPLLAMIYCSKKARMLSINMAINILESYSKEIE